MKQNTTLYNKAACAKNQTWHNKIFMLVQQRQRTVPYEHVEGEGTPGSQQKTVHVEKPHVETQHPRKVLQHTENTQFLLRKVFHFYQEHVHPFLDVVPW